MKLLKCVILTKNKKKILIFRFAERTLIPQNRAVINFPCRQELLFPNFDQRKILKKRRNYEKKQFLERIQSTKIEIFSSPSSFNKEMLAEPVTIKLLVRKLQENLNLAVDENQILIDGNTTLFGVKKLFIRNFKHRLFPKPLDLELEIDLKSTGS